ncbi:nuclear speckle splicing regulatory protein 1 [Rhineura floridana]|uniref:nuclear speckle splicing regulatory protein 1 n=1 Tax=Rhineura floridana TaxID=261503 RepID=UPI002AC7F419|nr:nuclear speckle splicing regulatory protein 1 [Rhineura floridana]
MAAPNKQYGLIFPKKAQQKTFVKHAVFMDDSDDESSVGESLQREALKKQAMKQTKLEIQRALAEDSTVYEYDNIYDDIQQKKAESHNNSLAGKGEKKPKYIQNILKAAELRKKEQEKRMEKKIQKEREMEGDAFDDKEAFVTSAYKKKLQERAEEEERERREAAVEACLDVTKQKDLSGFYRHLLNQAVGEEEMPKCSLREARIKEEELSGNSSDCKQVSKSPNERMRPDIPLKAEDNPDADSDLEMDTSDEENSTNIHTSSKAGDEKETRQGHSSRSGESSRHHKSRRDSRSSSEERTRQPKVPAGPPEEEEGGGRKEKSGEHREKERERRHKDHEKEERSRHDHYRRRDERQRRKDRKERDDYDRDLRKQRVREDKYSEWEQQEKERQISNKGRHRDREKDKGTREDKEVEEEEQRERKSSSPGSLAKDRHRTQESEVEGENSPNSERLPELKHKTSGEGTEQAEKPLESQSKFAKRSNEETVMSARDRYLARQMARVGTKSYIEKEED